MLFFLQENARLAVSLAKVEAANKVKEAASIPTTGEIDRFQERVTVPTT